MIVPMHFRRMIGRDIASLSADYKIKHIAWMGVVCVINDVGHVIHYWHNPN